MKVQRPNCPQCREPAVGTVETIRGVARFNDVPKANHPVQYRRTDVDWDSQRTIDGPGGKPLVTCDNGHEWESPILGM